MRDGALSSRSFRLLFASRAISTLGSRLAPVALAFGVLGIDGSPTDLGLVLAASTVPFLLLVLFGGVWADRLPRVRVMVVADVVRALAQALCAVLLIGGAAQVWELIVLQALYGAGLAFFGPASTAIVPQTVDARHFQQANVILELTDSVCSFAGPALAGLLIAALSPGWGLAFDAATFVLGALFVLRLRVAPPPARAVTSTLVQLREGWQAFRARRWLSLSVLFFTVYLGAVFAPFQVLGPAVSRESLGGPGAWAAISAALGAGALAGGALALRWRPRHPLRAGFVVIGVGAPLPFLLAARAPLAAIVAAALLDGVCGTFFNSLWFTAQQRYVPAEEFSRVSSWDWLGTLASYPVGAALAGPLAVAIGVSTELYGAGVLYVVLVLAVLAVPAVRNFPEGAGPPLGEGEGEGELAGASAPAGAGGGHLDAAGRG